MPLTLDAKNPSSNIFVEEDETLDAVSSRESNVGRAASSTEGDFARCLAGTRDVGTAGFGCCGLGFAWPLGCILIIFCGTQMGASTPRSKTAPSAFAVAMARTTAAIRPPSSLVRTVSQRACGVCLSDEKRLCNNSQR